MYVHIGYCHIVILFCPIELSYCCVVVLWYCHVVILIWWRKVYCHIVVLLYCDFFVLSYCSVFLYCHIVVLLYCDIVVLSYCSFILYCQIVLLMYCDIVVLSYCSVVLMMFLLLIVMLLSANDSVYFAKHQRTRMSTCWHWKNACLQYSNQRMGHQMLLLLVRGIMKLYTAWCNLFGICSTQDKSRKPFHAQYAPALLQGKNHSANSWCNFQIHIIRQPQQTRSAHSIVSSNTILSQRTFPTMNA